MTTPARGTRPRNRRDVTVTAAAELFYREGYARVGMSDIAAATNVVASAIYRHFSSKSELLLAAIRSVLAPYTQVLSTIREVDEDPLEHLSATVYRLAEWALDHREAGVLWQREARNLDADQLRGLREELRASTNMFAASVQCVRPGLDWSQADVLAWCALGVLASVSFHSLSLPRRQYVDLLASMVFTVVNLPMSIDTTSHPGSVDRGTTEPSRRDSLISRATELFAERGFTAVGVDDIAVAVGIAGPSIYSHFASKQGILVAAIERASGLLHGETRDVLVGAGSASEKLVQLVDSYVRIGNRDRFVLRCLLSEMDQLPPGARSVARRDQRRYVDIWVDLLREIEPLDAVSARIRVQAAFLAINDALQTPHLRTRAGFESTLQHLGRALLGVDLESDDSPD